jgi:hypothetical protein
MSEAKEKVVLLGGADSSPSRWLNPNPNLSYLQPSLQVYIWGALNFNVLHGKMRTH